MYTTYERTLVYFLRYEQKQCEIIRELQNMGHFYTDIFAYVFSYLANIT